MGIKYLNNFFRTECGESIKSITIAELSGKKIAVDISIYTYKYESNEALIENMYLMLATFRQYNIIPIFVFDGKPPTEKKALLQKRKEDKKLAEKEYNILKQKLENTNVSVDDKAEIISNMDLLKKQFIYITREKINIVKSLIRSYGATYYDAPGEADELCALLVLKNKVWACLSEDMDMFVYGCPRVLRYFSLMNQTVVLYNTEGILENLDISQKELREICVLSGTDYNCNLENKNEPSLFKTLTFFKKYKKDMKKDKGSKNFFEWLTENTDYIDDIELLKNIYDLFDLNSSNQLHENIQVFDSIKIANGPIIKSDLYAILEKDGFIINF